MGIKGILLHYPLILLCNGIIFIPKLQNWLQMNVVQSCTHIFSDIKINTKYRINSFDFSEVLKVFLRDIFRSRMDRKITFPEPIENIKIMNWKCTEEFAQGRPWAGRRPKNPNDDLFIPDSIKFLICIIIIGGNTHFNIIPTAQSYSVNIWTYISKHAG